ATQKRVELARALASGPQLLLLDEPAGGLSHEEVEQLGKFIKRLRDDFELTILLVEHHIGLVMSVANHVHVLDFGEKIAEGGASHGVVGVPRDEVAASVGGDRARGNQARAGGTRALKGDLGLGKPAYRQLYATRQRQAGGAAGLRVLPAAGEPPRAAGRNTLR